MLSYAYSLRASCCTLISGNVPHKGEKSISSAPSLSMVARRIATEVLHIPGMIAGMINIELYFLFQERQSDT